MTLYNPIQVQNHAFLTILQRNIELLEGISSNIDENTYLILVNNLQELYNIYNSLAICILHKSSNTFNIHNVNNNVNTNGDISDYYEGRNTVARQAANASLVFFVLAFTSAVLAAPVIAFTCMLITLTCAFIIYIHC